MRMRFSGAGVVVVAVVAAVIGMSLALPVRSADAAVVDLDFAPLEFDYADHTNISPTTPDCDTAGNACVGMQVGDIVRFNSVATVGGTVVDAAVTTTACTSAFVTRYEVSSSWTTSNEYFKVRQDITAGGMCSYRFDFYLGATYTGPGTGQPLTLRDVRMTALEIDNRQWVQFSRLDGYTLTANSELTFDPANNRFQSSNNDGSLDSAPFQVVVTFSELQSVTVGFGRQTSAGTNNFALAFQALPFDGNPTVDHGDVVAETPTPIDEGTPVPDIGFTTDPPVDPSVWAERPTCGVFDPADVDFSSPLSGPQVAGTYVTHCEGGSSTSFTALAYIDGVLEVRASVTPRFTG